MSLWNTKMSQTWASGIQKCLKHEPVKYKNVSNMSLWNTKMSQTWACGIQKCLKHEPVDYKNVSNMSLWNTKMSQTWTMITWIGLKSHECRTVCQLSMAIHKWLVYLSYCLLVTHQNVRIDNLLPFEPQHDKTNKMTCASSEDSDQPGHPPSLIKVFTVCMKKAWVLNYPLSAQRRLWSDWADAQAAPFLRWAHRILLVLSCGGSFWFSLVIPICYI